MRGVTVTRFVIKNDEDEYYNDYTVGFGELFDATLYDHKVDIMSGEKLVQVSVTIKELPYEVGG